MQTLIRSLISLLLLIAIVCPGYGQQLQQPYYNSGPYAQPAIHTADQSYSQPTAMSQHNAVTHAAFSPHRDTAPSQQSRSPLFTESDHTAASIALPQNIYVDARPTPYMFTPKIPAHLSYSGSIFEKELENESPQSITKEAIKDNFSQIEIKGEKEVPSKIKEKVRRLINESIDEIAVDIKSNKPEIWKKAIKDRFDTKIEQDQEDIFKLINPAPTNPRGNMSDTTQYDYYYLPPDLANGMIVPRTAQSVDITQLIDMTSFIVQARNAVGESTSKAGQNNEKLIFIESKIISIDTSDDCTLGVEISGGDRNNGDNKFFAFSRFGLNTIDKNGLLGIATGTADSIGFHSVLLNPDSADVIVRALAQNSHVKVESSPRVIVKSGQVGTIVSTLGVPYTGSITMPNAGITDSLAGYKEAGTMIAVKPTISPEEGQKFVELEFVIQQQNFVTLPKTNDTLPPPLHGDALKSTVRIPKDYTIIVGGLNRSGTTKEQKGIPGLMHIPLIKHVASWQKDTQTRSTLFFFITVKIIDPENEGKFDRLKYVNTQIHGLNLKPME